MGVGGGRQSAAWGDAPALHLWFPPFFLSFLLTFRGRRAVTVRSEVTSHPTLLAAPAAAGPAASCRPGSCRRRGALCSPLWLEGENTDSADGFVHRSLALSLATAAQRRLNGLQMRVSDVRVLGHVCASRTGSVLPGYSGNTLGH